MILQGPVPWCQEDAQGQGPNGFALQGLRDEGLGSRTWGFFGGVLGFSMAEDLPNTLNPKP